MTGYNLPPGCTDRMVDEAFGYKEGRRGVYTVTIVRTIEATIEIEASSENDAEQDARLALDHTPFKGWKVTDEDISSEDPREQDPDDERDARADYEFERDR